MEPRALLERRYPDLKGQDPDEAAQALATKMIYDTITSSYRSVWIGLLAAVGLGVVPAMLQTLIASALVGRHGRVGPGLLLYFELSLAWSWLVMDVLSSAVVYPLIGEGWRLTWQGALAVAGLCALATTGYAFHWRWPLRWLAYTAGAFALIALGVTHWQHAAYVGSLPALDPAGAVAGLLLSGAGLAAMLHRHRSHARSRKG